MTRFIFIILFSQLPLSCRQSTKVLQNQQLIIGKWKSTNPDKYADLDIFDSSQMHLLLRNDDQTVDSLWWKYKIDKKNFYIYTHAFLASKNEILTLTSDSFIFCRSEDKDTFKFAKFR